MNHSPRVVAANVHLAERDEYTVAAAKHVADRQRGGGEMEAWRRSARGR
jgi:hypothetical protein